MLKKKLSNFGLFKEPETGTWLLVQDEIVSAIGLTSAAEAYSPPTRFGDCMHCVQLVDEEPSTMFQKDMVGLYSYPIFRYMNPVPDLGRKKVMYVENASFKDTASVAALQKMINMLYPLSNHVKQFKGTLKDLKASNFTRQIITGLDADQLSKVDRLVSMTFGINGILVLVGEKIPKYNYKDVVEFVTPDPVMTEKILKYADSNEFELLGSSLLKSFMRGEKCRLL